MKKQYKVLSDNFRQYRALASNTFELDEKINVITDKNISELIKSFETRQEKIFFYNKHKFNLSEEREPIGEVIELKPSENSIGLEAVIDWNNNAKPILDSEGFYPSIEFIGSIESESDNKIFWKDLQIKAIASVESPASEGVQLLCASALIIQNLKGGYEMKEKIAELFKIIETGELEEKKKAGEELKELLKNDSSLLDAFVDTIVEGEHVKKPEGGNGGEPKDPAKSGDEKEEPSKPDDTSTKTGEGSNGGDDDKKKEEELSKIKSLSAEDWNIATEEHAIKQGYSRCSARSISDTFNRANRLYKAGESIEQCLSAVATNLVMLDKKEVNTKDINLSGLTDEQKKDKQYEELGAVLFKELLENKE